MRKIIIRSSCYTQNRLPELFVGGVTARTAAELADPGDEPSQLLLLHVDGNHSIPIEFLFDPLLHGMRCLRLSSHFLLS